MRLRALASGRAARSGWRRRSRLSGCTFGVRSGRRYLLHRSGKRKYGPSACRSKGASGEAEPVVKTESQHCSRSASFRTSRLHLSSGYGPCWPAMRKAKRLFTAGWHHHDLCRAMNCGDPRHHQIPAGGGAPQGGSRPVRRDLPRCGDSGPRRMQAADYHGARGKMNYRGRTEATGANKSSSLCCSIGHEPEFTQAPGR
jgi:hypothetical protein